jgi:hypothetical protein
MPILDFGFWILDFGLLAAYFYFIPLRFFAIDPGLQTRHLSGFLNPKS